MHKHICVLFRNVKFPIIYLILKLLKKPNFKLILILNYWNIVENRIILISHNFFKASHSH